MSYKITIVLDNVRSAFNVGSIFRTADGLGASVELIGITPIPGKEKKLDKTSLSALDSVKWQYFATENDWFANINSEESFIISIEEGKQIQSISLFDITSKLKDISKKNIYIVFGHEINGVSDGIIERSDLLLTIPMFGKKNSLNVGTCVGIVGYRVLEEVVGKE
jgi:tRNA G18 (ribose-2'-O)-methylase SpoU